MLEVLNGRINKSCKKLETGNWKFVCLDIFFFGSRGYIYIFCCLSAWFSVVRWFVSRDAYNAFFACSCCSFSWGGGLGLKVDSGLIYDEVIFMNE